MLPKIMFVCHGNICRSPMAEYVLKQMTVQQGEAKKFTIASSATSTEEIGNPVHQGTRRRLTMAGVPVGDHRAVQLHRTDYEKYDYIIGMDHFNVSSILRILGGDPEEKVFRLLDFAKKPRDIADPWYTDDFDATYNDIVEGCTALLKQIG